jgi:hypothetical protein
MLDWAQLNAAYAFSLRRPTFKPEKLSPVGIVIHRGQRRVLISPP